MRVLVVNAGSSTLKLSVLDDQDRVLDGVRLDGHDDDADRRALAAFVARAGALDAVGHRIVHGGDTLTAATPVTGDVIARLRDLVSLAPLHQPRALATLDAVSTLLPDVPAVVCFDTAFHATIPPAARHYGLPRDWTQRWPLQRYGFHGLSHAWAARHAGPAAGSGADRPEGPWRVVTCHLGSGSSLCAVRDGRSVDTTMGFTPLEGLIMATRSGTVDPGLVLWLLDGAGLSVAEVRDGLERRGGLAGLAGDPAGGGGAGGGDSGDGGGPGGDGSGSGGAGSGDLRAVLAAADAGDGPARQAYDIWLHRARRELGAMVAVLEGVDAVVFTGGIGEHQARVRADLAGALGWLGARLDPGRNAAPPADGDIGAPGTAVRLLVVPSREDAEIARQVRALLADAP
jgi:acetate kinase